MSASGVLAGKGYVQIGLNDDPLYAGLKALQSRLRSVGQQMASTGAGLFGAGAAGLAPLIPALMSASDAAEGYNRFLAVMGAEAKATDEALSELGKRVGRNQSDLRDSASSFQGMFVGLGMSKKEAAALAVQMTELSLDFASFNNLADSDAQERFLAGLSGSGEVFDRFGINIKEAALKTKLAEMGIKGTATELQKTQARIAIITESMNRQGATRDATTTAGSFQNQLKAIQAEAKTAGQQIGSTLIPAIQKYLPAVRGVLQAGAEWLKQNPELIVQYAQLAAGVAGSGAALFALGKTLTGTVAAIEAGAKAVSFMTANWQAFLAVGAVAAIALLTKKVYEANSAVKDFNRELERGNKLANEMQGRNAQQFDAMEEQLRKAKNLKEAEQLVQQAENNAAGARRRQEGSAARVAGMDGRFNNLTGNKVLEEARQELDEMTKSADQASERAVRMRKMLEQMKAARAEELKQAADAERQKRDEIEKTKQAEAEAHRQRINAMMAEDDEFVMRERRVNPLALVRRPQVPVMPNLVELQRSLAAVMSSTAAKGLATRVETEKKTTDFLKNIEDNTAKTAEAILKNPPLVVS